MICGTRGLEQGQRPRLLECKQRQHRLPSEVGHPQGPPHTCSPKPWRAGEWVVRPAVGVQQALQGSLVNSSLRPIKSYNLLSVLNTYVSVLELFIERLETVNTILYSYRS